MNVPVSKYLAAKLSWGGRGKSKFRGSERFIFSAGRKQESARPKATAPLLRGVEEI